MWQTRKKKEYNQIKNLTNVCSQTQMTNAIQLIIIIVIIIFVIVIVVVVIVVVVIIIIILVFCYYFSSSSSYLSIIIINCFFRHPQCKTLQNKQYIVTKVFKHIGKLELTSLP